PQPCPAPPFLTRVFVTVGRAWPSAGPAARGCTPAPPTAPARIASGRRPRLSPRTTPCWWEAADAAQSSCTASYRRSAVDAPGPPGPGHGRQLLRGHPRVARRHPDALRAALREVQAVRVRASGLPQGVPAAAPTEAGAPLRPHPRGGHRPVSP